MGRFRSGDPARAGAARLLFGASDLLLHSAALRAVWLTGWCIRSRLRPPRLHADPALITTASVRQLPQAVQRNFKAASMIADRVTTDGHDVYPRAIRSELGSRVWNRTNCYLNNRVEQDHRGIKGRCRPMLGFKSVPSARRYCRGYDELRNFLRSRSRMCQHVPAATRRFHYMRRTAIALGILEAA